MPTVPMQTTIDRQYLLGSMSNLLFRRGDYIYCEDDPKSDAPWTIRRIESILSDQSGVFSLRAVRYYRLHELPSSLIDKLDRLTNPFSPSSSSSDLQPSGNDIFARIRRQNQTLSSQDKFRLIQFRELYASKQPEQIPGSVIKGKCRVFRFVDGADRLEEYLSEDNLFLCRIGFNAEKNDFESHDGLIRVGSKFQATDLPEVDSSIIIEDDSNALWLDDEARAAGCDDSDIDGVVRAVQASGMLDRSLCESSVTTAALMTYSPRNETERKSQAKKPIVSDLLRCFSHSTRDISIQVAHNFLHQAKYDAGRALLRVFKYRESGIHFVDQIELFAPREIALFEDAIQQFGRDFYRIRKECFAYKNMSDIVEFYYTWKSSDRYCRIKELINKNRYSPYGGEQTRRFLILSQRPSNFHRAHGILPTQICCSCNTRESNCWYRSPVSTANQTICQSCWVFLRQYGHLKSSVDFERIASRQDSIKCSVCGRVHKSFEMARRHVLTAHCRPPTQAAEPRSNMLLIPTEKMRALRAIDDHNVEFRNGLLSPSKATHKSYEQMMKSLENVPLNQIKRAVRAYEQEPTANPISEDISDLHVSRQQRNRDCAKIFDFSKFARNEPYRRNPQQFQQQFDTFFNSRAQEVEDRECAPVRPKMRLLPNRTDFEPSITSHGVHRSLLSDIDKMPAEKVEQIAAILNGWVELVDGPFFLVTDEQKKVRRALDKNTARLCARAPHLPSI